MVAGTANTGSSPRVRGTHGLSLPLRGMERFIPARAGNSITDSLQLPIATVHPRACGELSFSSVSSAPCPFGKPT